MVYIPTEFHRMKFPDERMPSRDTSTIASGGVNLTGKLGSELFFTYPEEVHSEIISASIDCSYCFRLQQQRFGVLDGCKLYYLNHSVIQG